MVDEMAPGLGRDALDSVERNALVNASRHDGRADVGAVVSKVLGEFPGLRARAGEVTEAARQRVNEINAMSRDRQLSILSEKYPEAQQTKARKGRVGLPPLPGAAIGKVVFRLPPEPSGFMTIGHAMAFNINFLYSQEYGGKLWLRFEDTNPRKASLEYYDSFRRGVTWLGIKYDYEKNLSEDNEVFYGYGSRLIGEGRAYPCSCDVAKIKRLRFEGTPCEHRASPPEPNLRIWNEMLAKKHREGSWVVRLKGDMKSLDYSLRDPNIFRIIESEHPLTGSKYVVWPTYDLANTIEDELCGITHILRSSEFHTELQRMMREILGFRRVEIIQFSRFNFRGTPVQKRLLRPLVEKGLVSGWDDPRMPTVDGVRRRGILPEAIREFTLQVGYTKSEHEYDWSLLLAVNRKLLDPVSKRLYFVPQPVRLKVEGAPLRTVSIPLHPQRDLGSRSIETSGDFFIPRQDLDAIKEGEVFRLMELFDVEMVARSGAPLARYAGDSMSEGSRKVQWVTPDHEELKVMVPGPLFDDGGQFNKDSLATISGFGERAIRDLHLGEIVQLPRFGFCRLDSPDTFVLSAA